MEISQAGLDLIKRSEGFRAETYLDVAGYPTIGYGHKLKAGEQYDHGITEATATVMLEQDIQGAEAAVGRLVHVAMTQGQFDALVDFVFNLGSGALAGSTLLKDLNAKEYALARIAASFVVPCGRGRARTGGICPQGKASGRAKPLERNTGRATA